MFVKYLFYLIIIKETVLNVKNCLIVSHFPSKDNETQLISMKRIAILDKI